MQIISNCETLNKSYSLEVDPFTIKIFLTIINRHSVAGAVLYNFEITLYTLSAVCSDPVLAGSII